MHTCPGCRRKPFEEQIWIWFAGLPVKDWRSRTSPAEHGSRLKLFDCYRQLMSWQVDSKSIPRASSNLRLVSFDLSILQCVMETLLGWRSWISRASFWLHQAILWAMTALLAVLLYGLLA
mmetsp:Transcript_16517/g.44328  ORF Transcript_16517/g.44328 Transcript_16517/m.44328 type:complete len:120 (+) Transcript_16517:466-825(+)